MNDTQKALLEMYKDISKVLVNRSILFFGHYGTAIGAIRHGGFIPWDDDIDLMIHECDVPKVLQALEEGLPKEKYYVHNPSMDLHIHVILKVDDFENALKKGKAPFIDIFTISKYPKKKFRNILFNASLMMLLLNASLSDVIGSKTINRMFSGISAALMKLIQWFNSKGETGSTVLTTVYRGEMWYEGMFEKAVWVPFEDTTMPLSSEYDTMLRRLYGDYMQLPPEDKRTGAGGYPCGAYFDYMHEDTRRKLFRGQDHN